MATNTGFTSGKNGAILGTQKRMVFSLVYFGVGLGGILGSLLRYFISLSMNNIAANGFPFGTLLANLVGSFFLAWFSSRVIARSKGNPFLIAAIGTGLTGSFTTFSTFSLESLELIETGQIEIAILYILCSAIGGFFLAIAGYSLGTPNPRKREAA